MNQLLTYKKQLFIFYSLFICFLSADYSFGQYQLQIAFPNLTFTNPLLLTNSADGTNRRFVVEQEGIIRVFQNNSGVSVTKQYLNITDRVASGGELGVLGLAFHPDYENNGYSERRPRDR